ncbi:PQQ-binding-like beta-propeller repeat protein [Cystobacter ferrugineus]|uniref:Pyrrolo-quinoline quinone repeat domain-containing protein n=1 Tax=Cystobacter ferrugineus TaxID=83449 RepID=A0A1L9AUT2_9BACT|nr:PQQ-binding-like beta-propeller repeat protein [Cystobacter ferrugineus]OJH33770.1 hypothetical protein BON30_46995 [Cystobacter ferrugineus]
MGKAMAWTQRKYPALVLLCLLGACGDRPAGGEGTGTVDGGADSRDAGIGTEDAGTGTEDAGNVTPGPSAMTFSPGTLEGSYGSGDSISLTVTATLTAPLSDDVYLTVVDKAGVLERDIRLQAASEAPDTYYVSALTSSRLPAGRHQGALEVRLCRDKSCSAQHPGSPVYLPYDLQVLQGTNLTPLTRWPSVPDWETYQGNAAHTGYVPVTLDPSRFSPRWSWKPPESYVSLTPPVIANGLLYVANSVSWTSDVPRTLYALRESDKETEWLFDFGNTVTANPPAVSGGKVFIATTGDLNASMWSFDAATGVRLSETIFGAQRDRYYAPTIEGGAVYSACSSALGMCAFNHANGARNWFTRLALYEEWTPAVDANYAYSYLGGMLSALFKSTGQVAFTIKDPGFERDGFGTHGAPVLGTNGAVIAVSGGNAFGNTRLVSFNTATRDLNWSVTGRYGGVPVLAKGVVYATNVSVESSRPTLEARRESTGELLWSWTPPRPDEKAREGLHGSYGDLLVTDNLIFISTSQRVYAIDLETHAPVWSYWKTGNLAISANGVLYIDSGGGIGAVNLK